MTSAISRGKITFHPASCAAEFSASLFEHYAIGCWPAASIFVAIIQVCQPCSVLAAAPRKAISLEKQPWESERNLGTALASTGLGACPTELRIAFSFWPVPSGTKERSPPRERWVGVRSQGQAPKGRHRANQMCRPFGAVNDRAACPTVSTVGYVVTSLRDFEQHNRRTPDINIDRKFLRGRLLAKAAWFGSGAGFLGRQALWIWHRIRRCSCQVRYALLDLRNSCGCGGHIHRLIWRCKIKCAGQIADRGTAPRA